MALNWNGLQTILESAPSVDPRYASSEYIDYTTMGPNPATTKVNGTKGSGIALALVAVIGLVLLFKKGGK